MSALEGVRAVSLDAHGTLIELVPPAPRLRAVLSQRFGVEASPEELRVAFIAEVRYYRAHMVEGRDEETVDDLRLRCAEVLREALPPSAALSAIPGPELARALVDALVFRPFPEVPDTLRRLRAAGLELAVASNWDASLNGHLADLGLLAEISGVASSAEVGAGKPDPAVVRAALAFTSAEPSQAIHVGDEFDEDIPAARAAGLEPILLVRGGGPAPEGVRVIRSLAELPVLLGLEASPV